MSLGYDGHPLFAYSTIVTAPVPALSGTTVTVEAGHGARFAGYPFNVATCPAGVLPTTVNAEVCRLTSVAGDVLTLTRAQEGSSAKAIAVGWQIAAVLTPKVLTDIENFGSRRISKSANYTFDPSADDLVLATGTWTLTLPTAVGIGGRRFGCKNVSTGIITMGATSAQTIDGAVASSTQVFANDCLWFESDGANWVIV